MASATYISIHALREEGDSAEAKEFKASEISIHALREEGDPHNMLTIQSFHHISIHALREEGDRSTFPAIPTIAYFYPRPPRGGRQTRPASWACAWIFLSTPSARRATFHPPQGVEKIRYFYPRPPRGGRHAHPMRGLPRQGYFYPRPPRGGRRCPSGCRCSGTCNFYPRPPRGGRRLDRQQMTAAIKFLSTPSARRATSYCL